MERNLLRRLHLTLQGLWANRYGVSPDLPVPPFKNPGWVDLDLLGSLREDLLLVLRSEAPDLLTKPAQSIDPAKVILTFDEKRLRQEREFSGDAVAYVEAVWGPTTFAVDFAVRDLELMRRGLETHRELRPPQTDYEAELIVRHVRDLANDIARSTGQEHLIRPEDDLRKIPPENSED